MDATCFTARALLKRFGLAEDHRVTRIRVPEGPSRRAFLVGLTAVAASGLVDLSQIDTAKLLWEPGKTSFLLPPDVALATPEEVLAVKDLNGRDLRGNQFLTINWITAEALRCLTNNLAFTTDVNRAYDDKYAIGPNVLVRTPRRFKKVAPRFGSELDTLNIAEKPAFTRHITPNRIADIHYEDLNLSIKTLHKQQLTTGYESSSPDPLSYQDRATASAMAHAVARHLAPQFDGVEWVGDETYLPAGAETAIVTDPESGLTLRGMRQYDIPQDRFRYSFDTKVYR